MSSGYLENKAADTVTPDAACSTVSWQMHNRCTIAEYICMHVWVGRARGFKEPLQESYRCYCCLDLPHHGADTPGDSSTACRALEVSQNKPRKINRADFLK